MACDSTPARPLGTGVHTVIRLVPIAALAAVLLGVSRLPEPFRRSLVFEYGNPTVLTAYTAPFVHFSSSHLTANVAVLLVAGGTLAHLSGRGRAPWLFVGVFVALVSTLPIVVTLLNLAVPRPGVTYGFSGVNMALVGALPVAVVEYVDSQLDGRTDARLLVAWFTASTGYVAAVVVPLSSGSAIVIALSAGVVLVVSVQLLVGGIDASSFFGRLPSDRSALLGVGAWGILVAVGFPRATVIDGTVPNAYVHFVGYAIGFITTYLAYELLFSRLPADSARMKKAATTETSSIEATRRRK